MNLPARIPKPKKRSNRWHSAAHLAFVRRHACANCGSIENIEAAHVRMNANVGMGMKGHDFLTVSLCHDCHMRQHAIGERTFWNGRDVEALIAAFIKASPKRREIEQVMKERGL